MTTDLEHIKRDMLKTAEFAYQRLRGRLRGLTDEEYLWEPAPGCWSVRPTENGWRPDSSAIPVKPAPLTTIAWRLDHLIFVLEGERNATWLGATPVGTLGRDGSPKNVAEALDQLERAYDLFRRNVGAADAAGLTTPMGEIAGPYADESRAAFVLHELDELIHHASEIAAMRDMYHALAAADPIVAAAEREDWAAVRARLAEDPSLRSTPLVVAMAARERWDAVRTLVDLGFDVNASNGIPALHYAAAHNRLDIAELLVSNGADPTVRDTEFELEAAGWADHFDHEEVAKFLRG